MPRSVKAFLFAVPIAILGGLIGLGGAEFRLPVLVGPLRFEARQAVPLNLTVSLVTIVVSLSSRLGGVDLADLQAIGPLIVAMIVGAQVTAFIGPALAHRLSERVLERVILVLLLAIGSALIVEGFAPTDTSALVGDSPQLPVAFGLGLGIGLVSSLLGVAGGELIIPSFVFVFGVPIKVAGTASLIVSLPTVCVGLGRYWTRGAFRDHAPLREVVVPMAAGSVIGAVIGSLMVGFVSASALKLVLGAILILSALRVFLTPRHSDRSSAER